MKAMSQSRTTWLVYNAASGSTNDAALAELEQAFIENGYSIGHRICFPDDAAPNADELRAADVDVLAVCGGDGTIHAMVTGLYGWEGAILPLPGGTMNLLCKRLHGAASPVEIVARLGQGQARCVRPTVVRWRNADGLTGVLVGPGTRWNNVREALRHSDIGEVISGSMEAIAESAGGAFVASREPNRGRPEGYVAITLTPVSDGIRAAGYYVESPVDYLRQAAALLQRNFRDGPHDLLGLHDVWRLACPEGEPMGMLIDGEPYDGAVEEAFVLARCEVDLLATDYAG